MQARATLGHANFRWLVTGTTTSALGNAVTPVALAFAVLDLGGGALELGLVEAAFATTQVLTLLLGGVLGDRLPRAVMMQGSALVASAVQAVIAAGLIGGWSSIWLLALLGSINGVAGAMSQPSSMAMTGQTVPAALLPDAVALRRLLQNLAMISGFAGAGLLVAAIGSGWVIAVDAVTWLVAALCFHRLDVPPLPAPERTSMLTDLRAGVREVLRHTWLWLMIAQATLYHLVYGGVQSVLGPIVVKTDFGEAAWGFALSALMAGFLVGGVVSLWFRPRRILLVGTLFLMLTACFPAAMALHGDLWLLLAGAFLHGFGLEIFSVNWDLSLQQHVAQDRLARVYSLDMVGSFVARPVGLALTGPVSAAVGITGWLWVCTAVIGGAALIAAAVPSVRALRRLDETKPVAPVG